MSNNQGSPPDLNEMIRKFLASLGRSQGRTKNLDAFSRENRAGDGNGKSPSGGAKTEVPVGVLVLLFSALALLLLGISGFYTVDESERAITFRLGKPLGVNNPGLRWRIPFIDDQYTVNLSGVRTVEVGYRSNGRNKISRESLMLTDNLNIIDLQFAVQYLLKDPEAYLYNNRDPEGAVLQVAETAMREVVGRNGIDFVLYEGRERIASDTHALMQDILDRYRTGILVQQVAIQNVQPPDQVQDAFEDAIRARQDRERKINEGEAYANDIVPKSLGQSSRIIEDAEAYKQAVVAKAEGESQRFELLANEFDAAPQVTRQRLYIDALESVMARTNKIIIDQKGSNSLFYLPLDRLISPNRPAASESTPSGVNLSDANKFNSSSGGRQSLEDARALLRRQFSNSQQQARQ